MPKARRQLNNQKGVSLVLTILILSFIMGVSLGVSNILLQEIKTMRDVGNSVVAFYAAETGIEKAMTNSSNPSDFAECFDAYSDICYNVKVQISGCTAANYCLQSTGIFKETSRAIEVKY